MELIGGFALVFMVLGGLFLALFLAWPLGVLVARSRRMAAWPYRPMDNGEKRARWANRYHQATPCTPNQVRWPWLTPFKFDELRMVFFRPRPCSNTAEVKTLEAIIDHKEEMK